MTESITELGPKISEVVGMLGGIHDCDCALERVTDALLLLSEQEYGDGDVVALARRNAANRCWQDIKEIRKAVDEAYYCLWNVSVAVGKLQAVGEDAA